MSNFERLRRERSIEREIERQQAAQEADHMHAAAQSRKGLEQQAVDLGREIVGLLMADGVPTVDIWEPRIVGKKPCQVTTLSGSHSGFRDVWRCFNRGQGWQVVSREEYDRTDGVGYTWRAALQDTGEVMYYDRDSGDSTDVMHGRRGAPGTEMTGIIKPRYETGHDALVLLQNPHFIDGIEALLAQAVRS